MNLRNRPLYIIAAVLFLALVINAAVLTYISYNRYKQFILSKAVSEGGALSREIGKVIALGISIENIGGLNEKLKNLAMDKAIDYSMILDTEGRILFHSKEEYVGKAYKDPGTLKALASKETYTQKWGNSYDISLPLFNTEKEKVGILRVGIKSSIIKKELYDLLSWSIGFSILGFLLFAAIIYFSVERFITGPIVDMEKIATNISAGDLTEKVEGIGKDEIASLSNAINSMSANLRDVILKIKKLAYDVSSVTVAITESPASVLRVVDLQKNTLEEHARHIEEMNSYISSIALSSESLYQSAEEERSALESMNESISRIAENANSFYINALESASSVEEVMTSIKETAHNIEVLSVSAEDSAAAVDMVNATIAEVQKNAEESVQLAEKVSIDASEKGLTSLSTAKKGIRDIKESVNDIAKTINSLERRSEEIGNILNVIDEVAAQTNLLSLNAAILAAQAGEQGKSFTVVADEIKRLAERTSLSTKEIAERIKAVQTETQSSVEITSKGIETVERGEKLIEEVDNALHSILESSRASTDMSKSIQRATAKEANAIRQITNSIKRTTEQLELILRGTKDQSKGSNIIIEASEKIRNDSEQLKSATEGQHNSIKQISLISENVSSQAGQINSAIDRQKKMSNEIVFTIEKIQETTTELLTSVTGMDSNIKSLSNDAKNLLKEIQKFKV